MNNDNVFSLNLLDLTMALSEAVDLVSSEVANHHKQVAYCALRIGEELGLSQGECRDVLLAGLLHDVGALSLQERLQALEFELENPHYHSEVGYQLLKGFSPFIRAATIIRFHHVPWQEGRNKTIADHEVPIGSHILHLADRMAILLPEFGGVYPRVEVILDRLKTKAGTVFHPQLLGALEKLAQREYFWLDLLSGNLGSIVCRALTIPAMPLTMEDLLQITSLFAQIIDFRSRFTATHSSGVAATAVALARLRGWHEHKQQLIQIAGHLHDLGKLVVPREILEKPASLNREEFALMRSHTYYTYRVLDPLPELKEIKEWGAYHHERLHGKGYPFHLSEQNLSPEARLMAVADVFTAISEDRPYREGMVPEKVHTIMEKSAQDAMLDAFWVELLLNHYQEVDDSRKEAQARAVEIYRAFGRNLEEVWKARW